MSDSDCSNCQEYENCQFKDWAYDCYKKIALDVYKVLDDEDIKLFEKLLFRSRVCQSLSEVSSELFQILSSTLEEMATTYNDGKRISFKEKAEG